MNDLCIPKEDLLEPILPSEATVPAPFLFLLVLKFSGMTHGRGLITYQFATFRNKFVRKIKTG
jgi:hypothetical protein